MAVPLLTYGSESWVTRAKDKSNLQSAEMRFLRRVKGCTKRERIRNVDIREELDIYNINEFIEEIRDRWREHLNRMSTTRVPVMVNKYRPRGQRSVGRPLKRWR
ncbi:uncharacterized protein [Rhodnius prolixus]|uniref:uncharacterized protein n=1 Tax=Rhodnius prolixus TaxID=13249 RepID=UPI003D18D917